MDRREFLKLAAGGAAVALAGRTADGKVIKKMKGSATSQVTQTSQVTKVSIVRTEERATGVPRAIELLGINPVKGKAVLLKPNFNTADPFPASTHNDTLTSLIKKLKAMGAHDITIGERCGPPDTRDVMNEKGIFALAGGLGVKVVNFEELPPGGWVRVQPPGSHWRRGFDVARPVAEAECVVCTCCLKTHSFGGVFTMSLKLSVGITKKSNMTELHTSPLSMRKMIAEINTAYSPSLIVMDGLDAFVDGGPSSGELKHAGVIVAGTDRIAVDAVGLAVLKKLGSNKAIMEKKIFKQQQIARAVQLGLGASGPEEIELIADDPESTEYAGELREILLKG